MAGTVKTANIEDTADTVGYKLTFDTHTVRNGTQEMPSYLWCYMITFHVEEVLFLYLVRLFTLFYINNICKSLRPIFQYVTNPSGIQLYYGEKGRLSKKCK